MPNEYLIPFGIDGGPFFKTLNEMDSGVDNMANSAGNAGKQLTKTFQDASEAGQKLTKVIDADTKELTKLKDKAREVGRDMGSALSGKNIGTDFDNKIKSFTDLLTKFQAKAKSGIKVDVDTAKLEYFESLITSGADELEVLNQVIAHTRQTMAGLDPQSSEFAELAEQVELAEGFLNEFGTTAQQVETKNKSLKVQLRTLKEEMAALELAGKGDTAEFRQMALTAGQLEDQIGDVSARVRVLASDTKNIDAAVGAISALAGGFTAAQGAIALFGDENEEVNKIIQKVTGAMAVLQGVQALANALNKDSALSVLLFSRAQQTAAVSTGALAAAEVAETGATVAATTATEGFTAALLANPITAVLVAITAVVAALLVFTSGSKDAKEATDEFNNSLERNNTLLSLDEQALKRRTDVQIAQAKRAGASESEIMKIEGNAAIQRLQIREGYLNDLKRQYNEQSAAGKLNAADLKKLGNDILKTESEVADIRTEIQVKRLTIEKQAGDEAKERQKKAVELNKKEIEESKKLLAARKEIIEQQLKFAKELRDATIENLADQYQKERAQARANIADKIQTLNSEKALSQKAIEERNAAIVQLNENLQNKLKEIDQKQAADRAALLFAAQQTITDLMEDGAAKEVNQIQQSFDERRKAINEQYKNEADLREQLINETNRAEEAAVKKVTQAAALQNVKDEEERQVLMIETAAQFIPDHVGVEESKNVAVLQKRLEFAKKSLALLIAQGNDENSTIVLTAKKLVQDLGKELKGAEDDLKGVGGFDLQTMIFGDQGGEGNEAIRKAVQQSMQSIGEITDFIVGQYQRQIDKRQEVIDHYNDSIADLENQLQDEKDLREEGLANNVQNVEQEIATVKAAREEEIKQQEELQRKQNAARRAQIALDSIAQASNLITASTEIFASLANIPFVGVPLAITTIALMTGAFIAAKVKAFQAVGDGAKYEKGGYIDGPLHTQGGKKYRALDGSGVIELEGGEFVSSRKAVNKYGDLIEAINNDDISGMSDIALKAMLAGMGIHFEEKTHREAVQTSREHDNLKMIVLPGENIKPELSSINENVSFLAQRERDRVERWEDSQFEYIRTGNKTQKIKKN